MFYGVYPPWASWLIVLAVVSLIVFVICLLVAIDRTYSRYKSNAWYLYIISVAMLLIGSASIVVSSIQAYDSQVSLYNMSIKQQFVHVDSIDGVFGSLHAYNTTGNCYVYSKYDPYQKAIILDGSQLHNSTISLNGTTVYSLTTKPLSQEGIDQVCAANYGENAFNNTK
jgi:ABC-type transport system involved in multi-copper enzyme maturation permease subunit